MGIVNLFGCKADGVTGEMGTRYVYKISGWCEIDFKSHAL